MMEIVRVVIALIGTGIAAYYDMFNRKNVPESFLYGFLAISLLINVFDYALFVKYLPIMIPIILALFLTYKIGQIGGADVIVVAAIYSSLPVFPLSGEEIMPSSLVILAIATILASLWIMIKYSHKVFSAIKEGKIKITFPKWLQIFLLILSFSILIYTFMLFPFLPFWIILLASLLFIEAIFFVVSKDYLFEEMIVMKRKIEPEDVIAIEKIDEDTIKKYGIKRLTDEKQAKVLNKTGRKWPVLDMPMFLPFIFIALVIYLIMPFVLY